MKDELFDDDFGKWFQANGGRLGIFTDKGFAATVDLNKLKAGILRLIDKNKPL